MRALLAFVVAFVVSITSVHAWAHAAPHSVVLLDLRAHDVGAELRLPVPELEAALGRAVDLESVRALVARDLHAKSPDGAPWTLAVGAGVAGQDDQGPMIVVNATLLPPADHSPRVFLLTDDVIGRDVPSHSAWIALRTDFADGLVSGPPAVLGVTRYLRHDLNVDRGGGEAMRGLRAVFHLGTEHIAEGTDHLLFLLVLLLPAPLVAANRRWAGAAGLRPSMLGLLRIVTAFTLGHSFTLLLGSLGWLRLPSAPVEVLIAVSVLVSAVHAIRPLFPGREAWIAGGFGLVHGLAFASTLRDLHLDGGHLGLALFGFNAGIEAMQLLVAACCFPWLLLIAKTRFYTPLRLAGAALAGVAAIGWIAERAFALHPPTSKLVTSVAAHPFALLAMLAAIAVAAQRARRVDGLLREY